MCADVTCAGRERTSVHGCIGDDLALGKAWRAGGIRERESEADAAHARKDTAALVAAERDYFPA